MFAPSYTKRRKRECENCGKLTNVHYDCDHCTGHMCENCALWLETKPGHYRTLCGEECLQEVCEHKDVHGEVYEESDGPYVSSVEIHTCRDCGARIDEDGEIIAGRAA